MRSQLDDLQRQLGTGKKSDSYAGLGLDRGLTVGLRSQLSAISGYQDTITQVGVRLDLMQTALTQFDSVVAADQERDPAIAVRAQRRQPDAGSDQRARPRSTQLVGLLNTAGRRPLSVLRPRVDQAPVETTDHILNGDGTAGRPQAGHRRAPAGRSRHRAASAGWSSARRPRPRCRSPRTPCRRSASSSPASPRASAGATVSAPAGVAAVDVGRSRRDQSERRRHRQIHASRCRTAPSRDLTLTATTSATPGAGPVHHRRHSGGDRGQPAGRPHPGPRHAGQHRTGRGVGDRGRQRFLQHRRHPSAAARRRPAVRHRDRAGGRHRRQHRELVSPATTPPTIRASTAVARADQSSTVSYGARANEQGAAHRGAERSRCSRPCQFSASDPNGRAQYTALKQRIGDALTGASEPAEGVRHRRAARRRRRSRSTTPRTATTRPTPRCRICCRASRARRPNRSPRRSWRCRRVCRPRCRPPRCCCRPTS